jgi:hypothetical protein
MTRPGYLPANSTAATLLTVIVAGVLRCFGQFAEAAHGLASGLPMARVLFAGHSVRMMVLPLMPFRQIQLMVCAVLPQRYARRGALPVPRTAHR